MSEIKNAGCSRVFNVSVYGLNESIKRAKYPKSVDIFSLNDELTDGILNLAQSKKGEGHDNWLNGVVVQFDLKLSNKAWVEAERYHFLDFISSQSTMHKIAHFDLDKSYNKYVDKRIVDIVKEKVEIYKSIEAEYKATSDDNEKNRLEKELSEAYLTILYNNPASFELVAGMTTNYRQLKTIYSQRKAHRLPEWKDVCKWIETLPHSELITGKETKVV